MVDCHTSQCVWCTFEKAPTSKYISRITQLHDSFQDLRKGDSSVNIYSSKANRYLTNWLLLAGTCLLKIFIYVCFVAFVVSSKT